MTTQRKADLIKKGTLYAAVMGLFAIAENSGLSKEDAKKIVLASEEFKCLSSILFAEVGGAQ